MVDSGFGDRMDCMYEAPCSIMTTCNGKALFSFCSALSVGCTRPRLI